MDGTSSILRAAALAALLLAGAASGAPLPADAPLTAADLRRLDAAVAARPDSLPAVLERLRVLHRLAVDDEALLDRGDSALAAARGTGSAAPHPALLRAYRGAFRLLRAKHAAWPLAKREHLKAGLPDLDSAVAARPDDPEVRWLRLASCYHLPGFLGRKGSVKEDFAALARLLPSARGNYPPRWHREATRFVLAKGDPAPADRKALETAMAPAPDGGGTP